MYHLVLIIIVVSYIRIIYCGDVFWYLQLIQFFDIHNEEIPGYVPRPVITALHVHFIDSTAVYRCVVCVFVCVYACVRACVCEHKCMNLLCIYTTAQLKLDTRF